MNQGVDLQAVSRTMAALLAQSAQPVRLQDPVKHTTIMVAPDTAAAPDGLLPAILVAGEAIWREVTGKSFRLDIRTDPEALLGYRVNGIGAGSFPIVMLALMEARAQAVQRGAFLVNRLGIVWNDVMDRQAPAERTQPAFSFGAAP